MTELHPLLTAEWRHLLILNYEIDPEILSPFLPVGTELDTWDGKTLVSVSGFQILKTKFFGVSAWFYRNFEEVDLFFYVRREENGGLRRGVCFIKKIVSNPVVSRTGGWLSGEKYVFLPMRSTIERDQKNLKEDGLVEYGWRMRGRLNRMGGLGIGKAEPPRSGSEEDFIAERGWIYTHLDERTTGEYQVDIPNWQIRPVAQPYLLCDIQAMYGQEFLPYLHRRPRSAFLAEGSPVTVFPYRVVKFPSPKKTGAT